MLLHLLIDFDFFIEISLVFWFERCQLLDFQFLISIARLTEAIYWACPITYHGAIQRWRHIGECMTIELSASLRWNITIVVTVLETYVDFGGILIDVLAIILPI